MNSTSASWHGIDVSDAAWLAGHWTWPDRGSPPRQGSGSGIGLGTGGFWPSDNNRAREAIEVVRTAVKCGIHIIDTATNYGNGFAELAVGAAVRRAVLEDGVDRQEMMIISKAGYRPDTAAGGPIHSICPDFLRGEIAASRRRLCLKTIDAYLLHNPEEQMIDTDTGWAAISAAFTALEIEAGTGHIGCYGVAAAEGFMADDRRFHSLERLLSIARSVGGDSHHFRIIELPISLQRRDAFAQTPYQVNGKPASTLDFAAEAGLVVLGSVPMGGGRLRNEAIDLLRTLFPAKFMLSPAMLALQFARSVPGVHGVLAGVSRPAHVDELIAMTQVPRWDLNAHA